MDFWSRLIGGSKTSRQTTTSNNPQQRLAKFKRVYDQILQTWQTASSPPSPTTSTHLRSLLARLTALLTSETRAPSPHLCLAFASSSAIYHPISALAAASYDEGIIRETITLFAALVDSEEEDFLADPRFATALMRCVERTTAGGGVFVGEDTEGEIVELLFGIAAKIRLQPGLLGVWFTGKAGRDGQEGEGEGGRKEEGAAATDGFGVAVDGPTARKISRAEFVGVTQKEDFPLCYQLIDHVHHEGRIGDFARTGLLYVFESASQSEDLESWIVESDLPTLMASGLGALYSQLSRKLSILHPIDELPIILALSDYENLSSPSDAESLFSPAFHNHMETFLSYLTFWQDVLEHCHSLEVRQTLVEHFRVLFLQQLLYPSLLESSDIDGGSSVAVLTYLRHILDALDHPELVHMILTYLLAIMEAPSSLSQSMASIRPGSFRRRRSLMLLTQIESEDDRPNPSLFNLIDLVVNSVRSANPQTVVAALKLVTVIMSKNHEYASGSLLRTIPMADPEPQRTHGGLNAEIEAYMEIAEDIGVDSNVDDAYDSHLKDAMKLLETHSCYSHVLPESVLAATGNLPSSSNATVSRLQHTKIPPHYLNPSDGLLRNILNLFRTFLSNDVEVNLSVTETLINLACCRSLQLDTWLAVSPTSYTFPSSTPNPSDPTLDPAARLRRARTPPTWSPDAAPLLLRTLQSVQSELHLLRTRIPTLPSLLTARRHAFRLHDEISTSPSSIPLAPPPRLATPATPARSSTPSRKSPTSPLGSSSPSLVPSLRSPTTLPDPRSPARSLPQRMLDALDSTPSRSGQPTPRSGSPNAGSGLRNGLRAFADMMADLGAEIASGEAMKGEREREGSPGGLGRGRVGRAEAGGDGEEAGRLSSASRGGLLGDVVRLAGEGLRGKMVRFPLDDAEEESEVEEGEERWEKEVSLSHVLTNVVILQEFVMEVVAVMQVRASLFSEVKFA
ncbi:hypothetical protein P152DRAFT_485306 [Eremomyces bilateralis CBS 781.70]|uniref:FHF complex subunit HOOK-interacting protein C-terminal domain-containing protein n=1 Tax=Eremomyces bilateralis CBS 781.70 TaxID=1392243 RepID=A0A6G1FSF8_9PEZI|nr:uncharacterized protein P152DRAFT_485306 [Eremomyces bilateralis CBS 781.70]KAF1808619.1 hypothetical protein P152DRAFT_485306 [Eremomyces bilateralis CBS 781.70]